MLDYFNSWRKRKSFSNTPVSPSSKVWVIELIISLHFVESTALIQSSKYNHLKNCVTLNRHLNVIITKT